MATDKEKWAKDAFKPSRKGELHRDLNVPEDKKIPEKKMGSALSGNFGEKVRERAQAARNINK